MTYRTDDYQAARTRYDATDYRRCGRSGLLLPPISLGLWHNFGDAEPLETQRAVLRDQPVREQRQQQKLADFRQDIKAQRRFSDHQIAEHISPDFQHVAHQLPGKQIAHRRKAVGKK